MELEEILVEVEWRMLNLHEVYSSNWMYEQHTMVIGIERKRKMLCLQYYLEEKEINHENDPQIVLDSLEHVERKLSCDIIMNIHHEFFVRWLVLLVLVYCCIRCL
jgi:hypothetical protein